MIYHTFLHDLVRTFICKFPLIVEQIEWDNGYRGTCNSLSSKCNYPLDKIEYEKSGRENYYNKSNYIVDVIYTYGRSHIIYEIKTGFKYELEEIFNKYRYFDDQSHLFIIGWEKYNLEKIEIINRLYKDDFKTKNNFIKENPYNMIKLGWLKFFNLEYFEPFIYNHYDYLLQQLIQHNIQKPTNQSEDYIEVDIDEFKSLIKEDIDKNDQKYIRYANIWDTDINPPIKKADIYKSISSFDMF